jgi:hypothetical protein
MTRRRQGAFYANIQRKYDAGFQARRKELSASYAKIFVRKRKPFDIVELCVIAHRKRVKEMKEENHNRNLRQKEADNLHKLRKESNASEKATCASTRYHLIERQKKQIKDSACY